MTNKKPVGRPRVADKAYNYTIRLTVAQRAKMQLLGGAKWLKGLIQ